MKTSKLRLKIMAWSIVVIILIVTGIFARTMKHKARMETNLDEYMPKDHPAFIYSDQAEEWFNIKDGILIAIENKTGIYNSQTLQKIKDITKQLQEMDQFDEIDVMSLYTADNITGTEDGLDVKAFYTKVPETEEKLEELHLNVRTNDMVAGRLVSQDETVALIVAGMNESPFTEDFYKMIIGFADSFESETETIYVAGRPIVEGSMALLGPADMKRMVPIVLLVIAVVLYLLLRSFRATGATLFTVFISSIWTFGLMAALGVPIYSVSTMIPVMLIAIGVAYGIYFYNHLNQYLAGHPSASRKEAVHYTVVRLWRPLSMAAFTTMIGFISLLTSQVFPIKYFGLFTAFGIFISFLMTMLFLPAAVVIGGYRNKRVGNTDKTQKAAPESGFRRYTDKILQKKRSVYIIVAAIVLISIIGIQKVWINSSFLDKFEKESDIVLTDTFVNTKFGGTSTLNVILESGHKNAFKEPEVLSLIDSMQYHTEKLAKVGNSFSLADYLKRMNRVMNADLDEFYIIPESRNMVAQYMLLYEMSGDPENLLKVVNYDYNRTNITFQLKGDDSKTIEEALGVIEAFEDSFSTMDVEMKYAGSGYKALVFTDLILQGQIMSLILSLVTVIILLIIMFRSWRAGLIGAVPIVITALISFGVMGLLNIPLSTTTALLSSIAIGIGIDYAIHFIQHYRMNLQINDKPLEAIYATMGQTGKAILFNAIVVIAGFMVLLFSVFPPNRTLGALVSLNMFTSLIGTLSIMMILIYVGRVFVRGVTIGEIENKQ